MEHFKTDRHAMRWPKMRESKLISFIRYTFQPGTAVFTLVASTVAIGFALAGNISMVSLYFSIMGVIIGSNYIAWKVYRKFP